jgi:hypothetical protein
MATGDKLVNLDELKLVYDKLHVPSVQVQIPTGQWSGSSTRTYTVNATNVTADTIIDWAMDSSINYLTSDLTVTPGSGTIQFSTTSIPSGTINATLFFPGVKGEVVIQTLADVYSKSQVDTLLAAKVSTSNIVDKLNSTATDKPLSAAQGKVLNDKLANIDIVDISSLIAPYNSRVNVSFAKLYKYGQHYVHGYIRGTINADLSSGQQSLFVINSSIVPIAGISTVVGKAVVDLTDTLIANYEAGSATYINVKHNGLTVGQEIQIEIDWYI